MAEKKLFPRTASGLVREIGPVTALFVTIAFTVGWGWQLRVFEFAGASPLPENLWFAGISPGVMAVLITGVVLVIMTFGYSILISAMPGNALTAFFTNSPIPNIDLLDAVFFTLFSLAVLLFPFRRRQLFDSARFKPGGKLGTAAIGTAGLIANLIIAWTILTSPQDAYSILAPISANWYALGSTAVFAIIGALIYTYYRYGPPSKRLDYSGIFSEIPPE